LKILNLITVTIFVASSLFISIGARMVLAQDIQFSTVEDKPQNPCEGITGSSVCTDLAKDTNPLFGNDGIITKVGNLFAVVTGVISVFMMVIAGMKYILSAGDSSKTASAKNTIMYAAIGLGVAASAAAIVRFILNRL
jgi:cytochrome bd-type quinol oxidase subunit 2